ncbi:MAG TPA: dihydrofolate reductase family protein [Methylomirabilota bacterium]
MTSRIHWRLQRERRYPFGERSPDPEWFEPLGFPPPWPDRPWIYGVMVASANGVVAWRREGPGDDPVVAVLGGDRHPDERLADRRHMRHLRCYGDVAVGAQTLREQPTLVQTPQAPGDEPMPALAHFRVAHGLPVQPRHVIYSRHCDLDLDLPVFRTPGVEVLVVTTAEGAAALSARGAAARGVTALAEPVSEPAGLRRAHARLFAEHGVRYLDCEGGQRILESLHAAGLLDEVFLTETDSMVEEARHAGVIKTFDFAREGATLIAEGRIAEQGAWRYRRWRFSSR